MFHRFYLEPQEVCGQQREAPRSGRKEPWPVIARASLSPPTTSSLRATKCPDAKEDDQDWENQRGGGQEQNV